MIRSVETITSAFRLLLAENVVVSLVPARALERPISPRSFARELDCTRSRLERLACYTDISACAFSGSTDVRASLLSKTRLSFRLDLGRLTETCTYPREGSAEQKLLCGSLNGNLLVPLMRECQY